MTPGGRRLAVRCREPPADVEWNGRAGRFVRCLAEPRDEAAERCVERDLAFDTGTDKSARMASQLCIDSCCKRPIQQNYFHWNHF